jgi:beta-N-acetylhexosaminidase
MPRRSPGARVTAAVLTGLLLAACAPTPTPTTTPATPQADRLAAAPRAAEPSPTPTCVPAPVERRAAAVLVVGLPGVVAADDALAQSVVDLGVGGVFLSGTNVGSAEQVGALTAGLRERAGRPLLVSVDEESGRVAVGEEVVPAGPSPRRLAQRGTPDDVRRYAAATGASLAGVGIDWDLAPLLDLDDGPAGGVIGDRSFSADPAAAAEYGLAFSAGLADAGVTPTVKHFPGHGRSRTDTHATTAVVEATLPELQATDLLPFQRAVDAGVPVVMLNHLQYRALDPDLPASLSPRAYGLLREMGFTGVAITDSVGMGAVNLRWDFPAAAVAAVTAGADAVLATDGNQALRMRDALVEAVRSGALPEDRLSEAAARVTALAGGDPVAMSCVAAEMPTPQVPAPAATPAG